jgi:hypothetical protein
VVGLISWCLSAFGLVGAVLVTLLATTAVRIISIGRIAYLLKAPVTRILPWAHLAGIAVCSIVAAGPAYWLSRHSTLPRPVVLVAAGALYWVVYAAIAFAAFRWERRAPRQVRVASPNAESLMPNPRLNPEI